MRPQTLFCFLLLAGLVMPPLGIASSRQSHPPDSASEIACFHSTGFPTVDAPVIGMETLSKAFDGLNVYYLSANQLKEQLAADRFATLVLPYGSAFPAEDWAAIRSFLSEGGNLVLLGGYPFHQPVLRENGKWILGTPQPTYAYQLLIGPADKIEIDSYPYYSRGSKIVSVKGSDFDARDFRFPGKVYELTVRFTTTDDFPDEIGSAGPRDAVLRPLIQVVNGEGLPVACPLLEIDRLRGFGAGGRWVLEPSDSKLNAATIRKCVETAIQGAARLEAFPIYSCIDKGEVPLLRVNEFRPKPERADLSNSKVSINVRNSSGLIVFSSSLSLAGTKEFKTGEVQVRTHRPLGPGFYKVQVTNTHASWRPNTFTTGFWVMDRTLLESGPRMSVSKDWIMKNGKILPIIGTSYMAGNAGRKFLLEPNPYLWEKDFARMEKLGINYVRTGFWTGWRMAMLDPGWMNEEFLRSLDALLLTAASHHIVICFNLFAFLPPANGGVNPYLDPKSLEWQNAFATMIASRYKGIGWINYDLINEPSYAPPDKIWQEVPIGDKFEKAAWKKWVLNTHRDDMDQILDDWRQASRDTFSLPTDADLTYSMIRGDRLPRKGLDFNMFAQDVVSNWAGNLSDVIDSAGGSPLVTLGQDEGGMSGRLSQQWYYPFVSYTSVHTWWLNNDLLWDVVSTKIPEKPDLVEETGLMRLENVDGESWRTPEAARRLLERKFAYAFMGEGAGAVEWCWNINEYQSTDNEVSIGLTRADGTMKIETQVLGEFADFFKKAEPYLQDYPVDPIVVVIPNSSFFTGMPHAYAGAKRLVRVLGENFGVVPSMLSEYKLTADRLKGVKLVIVPDAGMISDSAAYELYRASRRGTKVLFTGAVTGNEYGKVTPDFRLLGINPGSVPVSRYEPTNWGPGGDKDTCFVTFGSEKPEHLLKSVSAPLDTLKGNILDEPLPLEMAKQNRPLINMLAAVMKYAGIKPHLFGSPLMSRVLYTGDAALIVCVNESSASLSRVVSVSDYKYEIPVEAGRSRLVLVNLKDGKIIVDTKGKPIVRMK